MLRSVPIVMALLVHSIFALVIVPVIAIPRWSDSTAIGVTVVFLVFTMHAAGVFGIAKRLKWGYSFSKWVFGFYMITSGLGLLGSLAQQSDVMNIAGRAILFTVFTWLFISFRSIPSVRAYFVR